MKLFHLSDLHIGKQLYHYNMLAEQRHILGQVVELVKREKPDVIILAGDIYDSPIPSAEAVSVFDEFLTSLCRTTVNSQGEQPVVLVIAGNHDSARRIDFASRILSHHNVHIAGLPPMQKDEYMRKVTLEDAYGEVDFYLLPFVKPAYVRNVFEEEISDYDMAVRKLIEREPIDSAKRNVLVSHQFYTASGREPATCDSEVRLVGGIENVDIAALKPFDYAALGHIHRPQKMGRAEYRYAGAPLQYSVSEAEDEKSLTMVTLAEKGTPPQIETIPLAPLHHVRKLTGTLEEILASSDEGYRQDYVSITLTDEIEAYQPKERLEEQFERILELRIDNARTRKLLEFSEEEPESIRPYEAFVRFFEEMNGRKMTEREEELIQQVMNQEMEERV